jgi:hypothetical protein
MWAFGFIFMIIAAIALFGFANAVYLTQAEKNMIYTAGFATIGMSFVAVLWRVLK